MSEKLNFAKSETKSEAADPAERFRVDVKDYPLLSQQWEHSQNFGDNSINRFNIDRTASTYVTETARLIAEMDGSAKEYQENGELEKPDHIIYLDKSARPVSWFVNEFWQDFSDQKRPTHSYLNIDRLPWLERAGVTLDAGGYMYNPDGSTRRPTFEDFLKNYANIPEETYARVRSLFVPEGMESEDPKAAWGQPTTLAGKNILVVDEVEDTGTTLNIARFLLRKAIPEAKTIRGAYFWHGGHKMSDGQKQQLSTPIWYRHDSVEGRGIGDVNPAFYRERYQKNPNPRTRAQMLGAIVLSEPVNLNLEASGSSRELAREVKQLHEDYQAGKVLLRFVPNWPVARMMKAVQDQGLRLAPPTDKSPDTFVNVLEKIDARRPEA